MSLTDDLRLQIGLAKPGVFVLDQTRLDQAFLGDTERETNLFVLDQSRLDMEYLGTTGDDPNTKWVDVLDHTQALTINRGPAATDTGTEFRTGVFTISLIGPSLDPHQNALMVPGVPVRLMTSANTLVFNGRIRRIETTYDKPEYGKESVVRVTLTVMDSGQRLSNIMRYGVISGSFSSRIEELLGKHGIAYNLISNGGKSLARTDYESTVLNHLNMAVASEDGYAYVDRAGLLQIGGAEAFPTAPVMKFSSDLQTGGWLSYTELDYAFDDQAITNNLALSNRYWGLDSQNQETGLTLDYSYSDLISVATYGTVKGSVEVNLANQADLDALGAKILARRSKPYNTVRSLTFVATKNVEAAAKLEPYQLVTVHFANDYFSETYNYRIVNLAHRMTGTDWFVTLTLQNERIE